MTQYIKISTLEYPRYEGDIRLEYPEITEDQTEPNFPCPDTYAKVQATSVPNYDKDTQLIYEIAPIQVDGIWTQQLAVRDMTDEELKNIQEQKDNNAKSNRYRDSKGSIPNAI